MTTFYFFFSVSVEHFIIQDHSIVSSFIVYEKYHVSRFLNLLLSFVRIHATNRYVLVLLCFRDAGYQGCDRFSGMCGVRFQGVLVCLRVKG